MSSCDNASQRLTMNVIGENLQKNSAALQELFAKVQALREKLIPREPKDEKLGNGDMQKEPTDLLSKLHMVARTQSAQINSVSIEVDSIMNLYL